MNQNSIIQGKQLPHRCFSWFSSALPSKCRHHTCSPIKNLARSMYDTGLLHDEQMLVGNRV